MFSPFDRKSHEDPSLHLIGGSVPVPGSVADVGTASLGVSETPARADHVHGLTLATLQGLLTAGSLPASVITSAAWTSWTPVFSQGVTPTITNTESRYFRIGRLIVVECAVTFTSAGTGGSVIFCSLPVTPLFNVGKGIGSFYANDNGTTAYGGVVLMASSTVVSFLVGASTNFLGASPAWTLANTDTMSFTLSYEAAT